MNANESMLRVAVVGIEPPEAGGAHSAENLMLKQIQKALIDHEVIVVDSRNSFLSWSKSLSRFSKFLKTNFLVWKFDPLTWSILHRFGQIPTSKFERELLRKKVDLVFFVGSYDRAIELRKIPFIATIWDLGHRDFPSLPELGSNREFEFREWRIRNILLKAQAIVVDSEVTKHKLGAFYGIDASTIYSLPFCPDAGEAAIAIQRETFAYYPAHYWSHKNHIVLLEAIATLVARGEVPRQLKLTGLDKGNFLYLSKRVKELGISRYVEFLGFVSKTELDVLYRKAAVVVMPSLLGPTNLPPLEALLTGCPVVVSSNARENLKDWSGVGIVIGTDVQAWSNALSSNSKFGEVDVHAVQQHLFETERMNIEKLTSIFEVFNSIRRTHE